MIRSPRGSSPLPTSPSTTPSAAPVRARQRSADACLVLIAEDEPDNQAILQTVAESLVGVRVVVAGDGLEAVAVAESQQPDLILLDLMMPLLDGFQVAQQLRHNPATARIPIIAISALARPGDYEDAIAAGCDDFVRKPFELDDLEHLIRTRLGLPEPA